MQLSELQLLLQKLSWQPVSPQSEGSRGLVKYVNRSGEAEDGRVLYVPSTTDDPEYENYVAKLLEILAECYESHAVILRYTSQFIDQGSSRKELLDRLHFPLLFLRRVTAHFGDNSAIILLNTQGGAVGPVEFFVLVTHKDESHFSGKVLTIQDDVLAFVRRPSYTYHFEKALEMATAEINNIVNTKIIKYDSSKYSLPEFASFLNLEPQNVLSLRDLFEDNKAFSEFVRAHTQSPYLRKIVDQAINLGGDNFV